MTHRRLALTVLLSGVCLGACLDTSALDEPVGEQRHKQIMLNQLPLASIMLNAVIGTPERLTLLTTNALRTETFASGILGNDLYWQLIDEDAQVFMKYLVRCALGPEDPKVTWEHPSDETISQSWSGQLGLCSAWASGPPSSECLELVSACMLAAENALGKSVATSQRGLDLAGGALPTDDAVTVKTLDDEGVEIASFGACLVGTTGADRDCGWSEDASLVGVCTPGGDVVLQCNEGSASGVIRVCEGHTGCNHDSTARIIEHPSMCAARDQITFPCPDGGSYAVMAGPTSSGGPVAPTLNSVTGQFPATELEVFDRREGAFFGSFLVPASRSSLVHAYVNSAGVVYRDVPNLLTGSLVVNTSMFACHDIAWGDVEAYATHRLCAVVKDSKGDQAELCAAHSLGVCNDPSPEHPTAFCAVDDTPAVADGDFGECTDLGGTPWDHPITVFLDHPCDLAGPGIEGDECPGYLPWPL
jgi:hypothetical protein